MENLAQNVKSQAIIKTNQKQRNGSRTYQNNEDAITKQNCVTSHKAAV